MFLMFPISRDPPEGGTTVNDRYFVCGYIKLFPISRDPPEGGTTQVQAAKAVCKASHVSNF